MNPLSHFLAKRAEARARKNLAELVEQSRNSCETRRFRENRKHQLSAERRQHIQAILSGELWERQGG